MAVGQKELNMASDILRQDRHEQCNFPEANVTFGKIDWESYETTYDCRLMQITNRHKGSFGKKAKLLAELEIWSRTEVSLDHRQSTLLIIMTVVLNCSESDQHYCWVLAEAEQETTLKIHLIWNRLTAGCKITSCNVRIWMSSQI